MASTAKLNNRITQHNANFVRILFWKCENWTREKKTHKVELHWLASAHCRWFIDENGWTVCVMKKIRESLQTLASFVVSKSAECKFSDFGFLHFSFLTFSAMRTDNSVASISFFHRCKCGDIACHFDWLVSRSCECHTGSGQSRKLSIDPPCTMCVCVWVCVQRLPFYAPDLKHLYFYHDVNWATIHVKSSNVPKWSVRMQTPNGIGWQVMRLRATRPAKTKWNWWWL